MEANIARLRQQVEAFLSVPQAARTREAREAILRALGVPHPARFMEEVWTSQWEAGVDRLLDPANTRIRPLEPTDFHFKWALEAFNALPTQVRARLFALKVEANGLGGPIRSLVEAAGLSADDFEVADLVALDKVHAEAAVTVRVQGGQTCRFEVSHFAPSVEALFASVASLFQLPTATTFIHRLPAGGQVLLQVPLQGIRLDEDDLPPGDAERLWPLAVRGVARHDALGDVLGTILRDPHHVLTPSGEVASIHNYELFHEIGGFRFGFVEPIFLSLWRRLRGADPDQGRTLFLAMVEGYRRAYVAQRDGIRERWAEVEEVLRRHQETIREYLSGQQEWQEAVVAARARAFRDPAGWVQTLVEACRESHPDLPLA
jgi:hypothetical protein